LQEPARTIVLAAALTGMRRGELFGLKWSDVDYAKGLIRITRSVVDQIEGKPKTAPSRRPVPMDGTLARALRDHQSRTTFRGTDDWVFASEASLGRRPLWPDAVLKRHVMPAVQAAGISKNVGWHTFRRTTASLLLATGASVKVSQELMGHASPMMTLGTYAQAIGDDKRAAQSALAAIITHDQWSCTNEALAA
jgi:integrase